MAMHGHSRKSVGIKELKDKASEIIASVQQTGETISVTKNNREVARITPVPAGRRERMVAAGLLRQQPRKQPLSGLKLPSTSDATVAIAAILNERRTD